eukprot:4362421-Lingulodinium_polyedra.AAC.1
MLAARQEKRPHRTRSPARRRPCCRPGRGPGCKRLRVRSDWPCSAQSWKRPCVAWRSTTRPCRLAWTP